MPKASNYQTPLKPYLHVIQHSENTHCSPRNYNSLQYVMWFRQILMSQARRIKRNAFPFTIYLYCAFLFMPNNIQKYLFTYLLARGFRFKFQTLFFLHFIYTTFLKGFQWRWGPLESWRKTAHKCDMLLCFWSCKNMFLFYTSNISSGRKNICVCV